MFDIQTTMRWVSAVFKDAQGAAVAYHATQPRWQDSFLQIALPVYLASFIVAALLGLLTGNGIMFGSIFTLLWSLAWTFVVAYIFDYLAGFFAGGRGFDQAYAVVALAIIPAAVGTAISPFPWIGWLISLVAGIYSLYLAYQFIPVFLAVPEPARVKHFLSSIVVAIVINIIVSMTLVQLFQPSMMSSFETESGNTAIREEGGLFSGMTRQVDIAEAAASDTYQPPANGKLKKAQVVEYVDVMQKTATLRERTNSKVKQLDEENASLSDVFSNIGGVVRMGTAEMEVVKTRGGNWAEHQWVKAQLETARIQQDMNDVTAHNYALFQYFQKEIEVHE